MRSETCNEILMEKVAFYESDWDMPDYVRIPDANGGYRRVNLDTGYDPDADWKRLWEEEDIEKSLRRKKGRVPKSNTLKQGLKQLAKHASAMRQTAVRRGVGGGHKPGSAIPKGVVRASEEAHKNYEEGVERVRKLLAKKKVTKQAFASTSKPDVPFGAKSVMGKRKENALDRLFESSKKY